MIGKLNHVAIVVPDLEKATALYRDTLGATVSAPVDQPAHGVTVVFVELPNTKSNSLSAGDSSPSSSWQAIRRAASITFATKYRIFWQPVIS